MPTTKASKRSLKSRAMSLVHDLPKDSSWDELMYRIYVRQEIEAGLADLGASRVHSHQSIRREFQLSS